MSNYKIRVNNEAESREAQDLLFELGYKWNFHKSYFDLKKYPNIIRSHEGGELTQGLSGEMINKKHQELTIPQLRDLVVLKRNSIDDATHEDIDDDGFKYRLINNYWHVITIDNQEWRKDSITLDEAPLFIKPINKPMKEYLVKENGEYVLHQGGIMPSGAIEVPEGADELLQFYDDYEFYKDGRFYYFDPDNNGSWNETPALEQLKPIKVLWQRHTQPKELPFVDDEPKVINKGLQGLAQAASALSKKMKNKSIGFGDHELTGVPTSELPNIKYMNGSAMGKTESLNDTYAEIEKVRQSGRTADQINLAAMLHIIERGKTYDSATGERSAHKTALAFNAITGHSINEAEVFLLLQILKDVRQWSKDDCHQDSAEDSISYAVLKAEALERNK